VKQTFFYDSDSPFCAIQVEFWHTLTADRVDYAAQTGKPIEFVEGASRTHGAEAIFRLLALVSGYEWMLRCYLLVPGFRPVAELIYRVIAGHRNAAYAITRLLWGQRIEQPTYRAAASLFSRALAFIYLIAFASFGMQLRGLIGSEGILPVNIWFRIANSELGPAARWKVPSLFWWVQGDFALLSIAWGGAALAAIAILARPHSKWQRLIFAILFVYYLSIVSAGQIFMSY
jgi:predicted DCC family thiol-disulfide oxidoreductase YuxK